MELALSQHTSEAPPLWLSHLAPQIIAADDWPAIVQEILATALSLTQANAGYIQWFNTEGFPEEFSAHVGFTPGWLNQFNGSAIEQVVSNIVLLQKKRIIVENVAQCSLFSEPSLATLYVQNQVQAFQATPILDKAHTAIGVLCTCHAQPHRPSVRQLDQIDQLLAYTASTLVRARHAAKDEISANRFRMFFNGMREGAAYCRVFHNPEGLVSDWLFMKANPALEAVLGASPLAGKRASDIFPELLASTPELCALLDHAIHSGQTEDLEFYFAALGKWLLVSAHCPAPGHVALICRDITRDKQRDILLKQAKMMTEALNRISAALHSSLDIGEIVQRFLSEGSHVLSSDSAVVLLLQEEQWIVSDSFRQPESVRNISLSNLEMRHAALAIQTRKVLAISNAQQDLRVHHEYMRHHHIEAALVAPLIVHGKALGALQFNYCDGPRVFTEHEIYFVQQLASAAGIALDNARILSEYQRQAQAFRTSEQRLQMALGAAGMGMWDWDLMHDTVQWNQKHFELFGIEPSNFHGTASEALAAIHPEDLPRLKSIANQAFAENGSFDAEFRVVHPDQSVHWIASKGQRIDDANALRMTGICFDITSRKGAELEHERYMQQETMAQMQRLGLAGEFAALLAHHLNQPLTAIRSFAEAGLARLRLDKDTPGKMQDTLHDIVLQSERAAQSIRDLRKFLARQPQELIPASLNTQAHTANNLMSILAEKHKVKIFLDLDKDLPKAMMRPAQIEQVFANLLSNAMDAISESGAPSGNILIKTRRDTAHHQLAVTIRDSGPGLHENDLQRVFDPLFTTKPGGIGLGLAICRSIVEDHGGQIRAVAGPGGCFVFTLPEAEA